MPDWKSEASRKLADSKLTRDEREEVARELAGYLEDLCSESRSIGVEDSAAGQVRASQSAATERAAAELHEDAKLGANLYRARREGNMNERTKRFWLPGFVVLFTTLISLATLQSAGFSPYYPRGWAGNSGTEPLLHNSLMIYLPWLCVLPFLGAAGAYWSRRAGSRPALRFAVGIFPAFVFLATFLVWVPASGAIGALPPAKVLLPAVAGLILSWVVIPGMALLVGALPFLGGKAERAAG